MTTTVLRGRKPACLTHLTDCLLDAIAVNDDDRMNDARTREVFEAVSADGTIDADEILRLRRRLWLDWELTRISGCHMRWGAHGLEGVSRLVDRLRTVAHN